MQAGLPPGISNADIADILSALRSELNRVILAAHLQGIYSGILVVALWTIFMQKSRSVSHTTIATIIIVYIMTLTSFSLNWSTVHSALVENGENILTQIMRFETPQRAVTVVTGVMARSQLFLSTPPCSLFFEIWRCWLVWGQCWQIVPLPALCLVAGIVFKIIVTHQQYAENASGSFLFSVLYASLTLATTTLCTLLMIYRILAVARATDGGGTGPKAYRRLIEIIIESSALYAVSLILYVAFFACGNEGVYYLDPIAGFTRGIAPTLLFGRVAAGHARPDDSWKGSVMTSPLRFGQDNRNGMSSREDSVVPGLSGFEDDLEAQRENPKEAKYSCIDLREDATQRGSQASEGRSGSAGDDPEANIVKANR